MKNPGACAVMAIAAVLLGGCSSESTTSTSSGNSPSTPSPSSGSATLTWEVPNQDEDGNCAASPSGYQVHRGPAVGNYTTGETVMSGNQSLSCSSSGTSDACGVIQTCTYTSSNLPSGVWHLSLQAFDASGVSSGYSNEASIVVP